MGDSPFERVPVHVFIICRHIGNNRSVNTDPLYNNGKISVYRLYVDRLGCEKTRKDRILLAAFIT